jgi:branched-chain amino acid transport system permease protein
VAAIPVPASGAAAALQPRAKVLLALVAAALAFAPLYVSDYVLSVLILCLYFAYTGQAWNIMTGFAGQLSLGHSLYVGVGAYVAAMFFVKFGVNPWLGALGAIAACTLIGAVIGFLAFRFGVGGVYFAILTIAFAEFTRIGFDHLDWLGGSGGLFIPVASHGALDLLRLRGSPVLFFYLALALACAGLAVAHALLRSRFGYYWQAIRENEDAAQALGIDVFRYKLYAVMISAALTAIAGVFFAFYYNTLFPEQIFSMGRSIEIILGPIIGGLGTLAGPIVGAFVLTPLADLVTELMEFLGVETPGVKQVFYGVCLLIVVVFLPNGIWPALARRLGFPPPGGH